ncbi:MAG: sulfotransferase family 2 domain-containing protein [Pseudomonadota bacterium]|nr:sulfotransferase family 2 domain-containing protein [Pseudomonadota bacterium]
MLLSHKYKFLFVHIAKTGGTSVRDALNPLRWRDPMYAPMFVCSKLSGLFDHRLACKLPRHAKAVAAEQMLPQPFFDGLFKFVFVRNPWDLQVSSYHHLQRERPHLVSHLRDFDAFVRHKLDPERPYQYHLDTSIELQSDYIVDLHGRVLVDFIGRYEQLQDDFDHVCQTIGIAPRRLPHKRRAEDRARYRGYYDDSLRDLVHQHFKTDIERFNYSF